MAVDRKKTISGPEDPDKLQEGRHFGPSRGEHPVFVTNSRRTPVPVEVRQSAKEPLHVQMTGGPDAPPVQVANDTTAPLHVQTVGSADVSLQPSSTASTAAQALWTLIHKGTNALSFASYNTYIQTVLCGDTPPPGVPVPNNLITGVDAYSVLRAATEAYLLTVTPTPLELPATFNLEDQSRTGRPITNTDLQQYLSNGTYIDRITAGLASIGENVFCRTDLELRKRVLLPSLLELIWSYWLEQGMLVQSVNAIALRFQNKRGPHEADPLANLTLHPFRSLANLVFGYIQEDDHRLTIARRAYEYQHQYGLSLIGRAVPQVRPVERRSKFLEAFHSLLHQSAIFFHLSSDLTVRPDAFPLLNALREVHLLLAEGAHNQFRDLTWTARVEMLIQQWLLARPEMREFLGTRGAVPYAEEWMVAVDTMKRIMGWSDTPVTYFHELATSGEKILLAIRYGNWNVNASEEEARGWAQFWKTEIQRYIHAYQAVTGVDLGVTPVAMVSGGVDATSPAILLQQRMAQQRR